MATLFNSHNTYVSTEIVEHNGQRYFPGHLVGVYISKNGNVFKGMIGGCILAFIGMLHILASTHTSGGAVLFLIGGIFWAYRGYHQNQNDKVRTSVTVSFSGGRYTGPPDIFIVTIYSYNIALELQSALWKAKKHANSIKGTENKNQWST